MGFSSLPLGASDDHNDLSPEGERMGERRVHVKMDGTKTGKRVPDHLRVGFIGAGKMAQAIIKGLLSSATVKSDFIIGSACRQPTLDILKGFGIKSTTSNTEVVQSSDVIFLAVKPHLISGVLQEVASIITPEKTIVSIAAGITLDSLEKWLPAGSQVVRVMPSLPVAVGCGTSVICLGTNVTTIDGQLISALLDSCGFTEIMPESYIDVVTATTAPMFGAVTVEAISDGAVKMGLPRHLAIRLAAQSLMGAAKFVLATGEHPAAVKDAVCSPGGTTIAALHQLELGGYRGALVSAVEAATLRARELGAKK